jgi:hypothetical protein
MYSRPSGPSVSPEGWANPETSVVTGVVCCSSSTSIAFAESKRTRLLPDLLTA